LLSGAFAHRLGTGLDFAGVIFHAGENIGNVNAVLRAITNAPLMRDKS
jgi:hypothetical protein